MIPLDILLIFIATTFVVVLSPGPAAISVAAEGASGGLRCSMLVVAGIASANIVFFVLSATGIATLILASSELFMIIKWIGVGYLLYLGFGMLLSKSDALGTNRKKLESVSLKKLFMRGFILEMSNPKALLYFSALLPQFIDTAQPIVPQLAILASIALLLDLVCYSLYGYLGRKSSTAGIKPIVVKIINKAAGSMLIFAGLKMATVQR